ncbi:MAG: VOC family protein [Cyanobacteriota bacterium]
MTVLPQKFIYHHLHTALWVTDLARAEHFYGAVLGIPKVERLPFDFPGAWYQVGDSQIHLIVTEKPVNRGQHAEKWGRNPHLALGVDDLEMLKTRLVEAGYEVQMSPSGRAALFVQDPDGNVIELSSANPFLQGVCSSKER